MNEDDADPSEPVEEDDDDVPQWPPPTRSGRKRKDCCFLLVRMVIEGWKKLEELCNEAALRRRHEEEAMALVTNTNEDWEGTGFPDDDGGEAGYIALPTSTGPTTGEERQLLHDAMKDLVVSGNSEALQERIAHDSRRE